MRIFCTCTIFDENSVSSAKFCEFFPIRALNCSLQIGMPGHWIADDAAQLCENCFEPFSFRRRKHHCRDCGGVFCDQCTPLRRVIAYRKDASAASSSAAPVRICGPCVKFLDLYDEVIGGRTASPGADRGDSRRQHDDATQWFDAAHHTFARHSAVSIKRRIASTDDLQALSLSMVPDMMESGIAGNATKVRQRNFLTPKQLLPTDVSSLTKSAGIPTVTSATLKANFCTALQEAIQAQVDAGVSFNTDTLLVADFASYY